MAASLGNFYIFVAALFLPLDQMIRGIFRCVCSSVCLSANISLGFSFSYTKFTVLVFSMHIPWVRHFLMTSVMTTLSLWHYQWGGGGLHRISQTHLAFIMYMRLFHMLFLLKVFHCHCCELWKFLCTSKSLGCIENIQHENIPV